MNPALLATLGTLVETASLKTGILPPVSGENAPAFTLPKMAVAAVAERVHSAKNQSATGDAPAGERSGGDAGANGAVTSATYRAASGHAQQPRNVATSPVIQQVTKAVVQKAPQRPTQQQELTPLPPQLQELTVSCRRRNPNSRPLGDLRQ